VAELGISDLVSTYGWVDFDNLLPVLKGSDAVVYIGGDDSSNRFNIPSKIHDYVGAGTPILAVVDESFRAADFVLENELGIVAHPGDTSAIASAFATLYEGEVGYSATAGDELTRRQKISVLSTVLNEMVDRRGGCN